MSARCQARDEGNAKIQRREGKRGSYWRINEIAFLVYHYRGAGTVALERQEVLDEGSDSGRRNRFTLVSPNAGDEQTLVAGL
jgi:hypothetical protein